MSLPGITVPPGTPAFIAENHAVDEDPCHGNFRPITGHSRTRRLWTMPERVVPVSLWLEPSELHAMDTWYERTLLAGERQFAAHVRNQGPGMLWWTARWINYESELVPGGRGKVSGTLFLTGEGSVEGPDTASLATEVVVALLSIPSTFSLPKALAAEVVVDLRSYWPTDVPVDDGSITLVGRTPTVVRTTNTRVFPGVGSITIAGAIPAAVNSGVNAAPPLRAMTLTGLAPQVVVS